MEGSKKKKKVDVLMENVNFLLSKELFHEGSVVVTTSI